MKKHHFSLLIFILSTLFSIPSIHGQNFNEIIKALSSDRTNNDQFGYSVSISENYAIIGARTQDTDANNSSLVNAAGAAYIFKRTTTGNWVQVRKLVASDRNDNALFGCSVSIFGDYAVVGALGNNSDNSGNNLIAGSGAVFIFKKDFGGVNNWGEIKKITASDRGYENHFGFSVAIDDNYIVVGAPEHDMAGNGPIQATGAAYIFKKNKNGPDSWGQVKKIYASDGGLGHNFGYSVSIFGDYAIVGAMYNNGGAAYVFKKDNGGSENWGQLKKIVAPDKKSNDIFGRDVDIDEDYIVVGADNQDYDASGNNPMSKAGAAYIFKKDKDGIDNWGFIKKIVASDRADNDYFGINVAISGDYIVVGAHLDDNDSVGSNVINNSTGAAYIFYKPEGGTDNWGEVQKIVASQRGLGDRFGANVDIYGGYIISGAHENESYLPGHISQVRTGAAYIFEGIIPFPISNQKITEISTSVFPNPFQDFLNIENGQGIATIYNILGQPIQQFTLSNELTQISTTNLIRGSYLLVIQREDGTRLSFKIIKYK